MSRYDYLMNVVWQVMILTMNAIDKVCTLINCISRLLWIIYLLLSLTR